jgi:hypothetical protein
LWGRARREGIGGFPARPLVGRGLKIILTEIGGADLPVGRALNRIGTRHRSTAFPARPLAVRAPKSPQGDWGCRRGAGPYPREPWRAGPPSMRSTVTVAVRCMAEIGGCRRAPPESGGQRAGYSCRGGENHPGGDRGTPARAASAPLNSQPLVREHTSTQPFGRTRWSIHHRVHGFPRASFEIPLVGRGLEITSPRSGGADPHREGTDIRGVSTPLVGRGPERHRPRSTSRAACRRRCARLCAADGAQISEKCDGGHILRTIVATKMTGVGSFQAAAYRRARQGICRLRANA